MELKKKMELKERLEILGLNNKFKGFKGIKSFRIATVDDELTDDEKNISHGIHKEGCEPADKLPWNNGDHSGYLSWITDKIVPFISCESEIIVIDDRLVFCFFEDIELFLEQYFEVERSHAISLINRDLKKFIAIFPEEYFLEYFEQDI